MLTPKPDTSLSPRTKDLLVGLLEIAAVGLLIHAYQAFFAEHGMSGPFLVYDRTGPMELNASEGRLYLLGLCVGLPAAVFLADACSRLMGRRLHLLDRLAAHPRLSALCIALAAGIFVELAAKFLFEYAQFIDDERVYLFQARALLAGHMSVPRPELPELFHFVLLITTPDGRWAGVYAPGQPALLALGMLLGAPHVFQALFVAGIVYFAARLSADLWDAKTSILVALFTAASPLLLMSGATWHNAIPTTFFVVLAARSAVAVARRASLADAALVGIGVGAALLCRPFDAVLASIALATVVLGGLLRKDHPAAVRRRLLACGVGLLAFAPFLIANLVANAAVTGDPLRAPYELFTGQTPGTRIFGFGLSPFGMMHTVQAAFSKAVVTLIRLNAWQFGWPISLAPLLLLVYGIGADRPARWILAGTGVHFLGYFFYVANAVHDVGSPYHLPEVPFLAILTVRVLVGARDRLATLGEQVALVPGRLAGALFAVGALTFAPTQLERLGRVAAGINAPIRAAERVARENGPIFVLWRHMQSQGLHYSFVFCPPPPGPHFDDPVLWVRDDPAMIPALVEQFPGRAPYRLKWTGSGKPHLVRLVKNNATPDLNPAAGGAGP